MSRPVIIKIEDHALKSNSRATGSIDIQLLRSVSKISQSEEPEYQGDYLYQENESKGLVRNLINRYESVPKTSLLKFKSKSMSDLTKPKIIQNDFLDDQNQHLSKNFDDETFDFKKVFSKFENLARPSSDVTDSTTQRNEVYKHILPEGNLKKKAKVLLEQLQSLKNLPYDLTAVNEWQNNVKSVLQFICDETDDGSFKKKMVNQKSIETNFPKTDMIYDGSRNVQINSIKNVFETKTHEKLSPRPITSYSVFFTGKPTNNSQNTNELENNSEHSEGDNQGSYNFHDQPVLTSTLKIQELKTRFESNNDHKYTSYNNFKGDLTTTFISNGTVKERVLSPAKDTTLGGNIATSKNLMEELMKEIEDNEDKIESLTISSSVEASKINELLIQILIKLDDVETYNDSFLLTERRKGIQYVQSSIKKLRKKMREN